MQGPEYVKLLRRSYDLFLDLQQQTGQVGFSQGRRGVGLPRWAHIGMPSGGMWWSGNVGHGAEMVLSR